MEKARKPTLKDAKRVSTREGARGGQILGGRFRTDRILKATAHRRTVLATELDTDQLVVLKTVPLDALTPGARMRLEYEVALLRRVSSARLAAVRELAREDGILWLITPFVPGRSLDQRLREKPLTLDDVLVLANWLSSALADAQAHRVLHRNVKPANIIVNEDGPIRRATLNDFGLAQTASTDTVPCGEAVLSARYMSPEQAGSIDYDVGAATDLYSAGVVLYECLAGRPPFAGETVSAVLLEHMTSHVPELRSLGLRVPRALDELIQRLLRKDPRDRYQSAEAVRADLEAIAEALGRGEDDPNVVIGARDRRGTLTEPAFVARSSELEQLDAQIEQTKAGQPGLVLLEGCSGGGKTRLLDEMSRRGTRKGLWVLRGLGSSEVGQRPFQMLDPIIEEFVAAVRSDPALAQSMRDRLAVHRDSLTAILPSLAAELGWQAGNATVPEAFGEARSIRALSDFLDALGTAERPALVVLDDCQWADELTAKLIQRWNGRERSSGRRFVLLVVAVRSEELPDDHLLRRLRPSEHLRLSPFGPHEIRQLAESMAGPLPDEVTDVVSRLSEGSPFMASAVLRGLVESGALRAGPEGWQVERLAMSNLQSSSRAASFLSRRIDLLPPSTAELLSVGAVLGKEFELAMAADLAGQAPVQVITALDEARARHLVWTRPDGSRCLFVHDRIRSALLERMSAERRQGVHHRAALHLQRTAPDRVSDLAYHFDAAGESRLALDYALQAAEQARAQHSLDIAEQQYRIADRGAAEADRGTQYRIVEGLGEVLMLRGRYDAAAKLFERAAGLAEGSFAKAQIRGKLGELAFKRGDTQRAIAGFEAALRLLGIHVPRRRPVFLMLFAWETLVQILHTVLPWLFVHRRKREPSEAELLCTRLFSRLAHGYWFARSKPVALWAHLRGMNLAERYPPTLELAQAYSEHAPGMSLVACFNRGIRYARKSLEIRKSFGDLWGQGQSLHYYGVVLYTASRFAECVEKCREAVRLLERTGDYWEMHIARYQIAASLYHLGDLRGALREAQLNHASGLELGDEQASGIILDVWSRATGGAIPQEIVRSELQRTRHDAQGKAQVLLGEGVRLLRSGDLGAATATFQKAIEVADRAGVRNAYTLPNFAWLVTARRHLAQQQTGYTPRQRRRLLASAERAAHRALRTAWICRNDVAHVLREYGLISAMQGKLRRARRLFQRSLAIASRQQARYEHARALLACGEVGLEAGWRGAAQHVMEAKQCLGEMMIAPARTQGDLRASEPVTWSLADRFDTVLNSGRRIASALSETVIFEEARTAALRLLRGEHCLVLRVVHRDGPPQIQPLLGDLDGDLDRQLVFRALQSGRAVGQGERRNEHPANGAAAMEERSCLCVPVFVRGHAVACFYVTHQHVRGLFGPDEERLADFVATIAGAALENADGFRQLQQLNETLELRVAERTQAAESRALELAQSNRELQRTTTDLRQTEDQLRVAIKRAEAASQAKSRFLATMSHEIRTPMNGIIGMTELAMNTDLTPQQHKYLDLVRQSADDLLRMLNDILDFSKIEAGKMELESVEFDLREVLAGATQLLAAPASKKGLELICRVDPGTPSRTVGDPGRLRQVIVNLVGNAIKFTERGEVLLDVSVEQITKGSVQLRFAVKDTGIGIPKDKQQCIFEAFRQRDSSTTRRFGGTGLGLAISAELVDLMGGKIGVESEPGQGSTFQFTATLPLAAGAGSVDTSGTRLPQVPVLVVDDNATSRRVIGEILRASGMKVTLADRGDAALELLDRAATAGEPYPLVTIDAVMKGRDGWSLVDEIRRHRFPGDPDVVLLLPPDDAGAYAHCQRLGVTHYLTKPVMDLDLIRTVADVLEQSRIRGCRCVGDPVSAGARRLRVLLAEDGPINQEVATGLLELAGHEVEIANNGREVLELMEKRPFDVVLMDIEMPEMDGLDATAAIRCREEGTAQHTPVIAMSAHAVEGFQERCLAAGMDGCLAKPIETKALYQTLEAAVAGTLRAVPQG